MALTGTPALGQDQPTQDSPWTGQELARRLDVYAAERKLIRSLPDDIDKAAARLVAVAPQADRWLITEPLLFRPIESSVIHPRKAGDPPQRLKPDAKDPDAFVMFCEYPLSDTVTADTLARWSLDLWNPASLKERWLDIRKKDEDGFTERLKPTPEVKANLDLAYKVEEALDKLVSENPAPNVALEPGLVVREARLVIEHHRLVEAMAPWIKPATSFIHLVDAFESDLATAMAYRSDATNLTDLVESRPGQHRPLTPSGKAAGQEEHFRKNVFVLVAGGLGSDTEVAHRHRYAMSDREYIADARTCQPTTWPVCEELGDAATNFDFWYRWATDERWYQGSNRRLDPGQWPKDDPKTHELFEEFASVVLRKHIIFIARSGDDGLHIEQMRDPATLVLHTRQDIVAAATNNHTWGDVDAAMTTGKTREGVEDAMTRNDTREMLVMYFRLLDGRELAEARSRIPAVTPLPKGRLLPPLQK
jgi:hypothetical protein